MLKTDKMKDSTLVKLVKKHLDASRFETNDYNSITNFLKANYTDKEVFSTMKYIRGEYTESEEEFYFLIHS